LGFDTGPANGLLDAWCQRQQGEPFDRDGAFAASGRADRVLLDALLHDPYFALAAPKSTGREYFHLEWLSGYSSYAQLTPADVHATLLELTVRSMALAIARYAAEDRKSTRLNSSHVKISYAVFCLKQKKN